MKVSIITVVYNGHDTIRDCIESVLTQTHPNLEYIVIDGASTDGTADLVRSYGDRVSRFVSEPDKGLYDAMNKGIALATGEVIGFLNADDLYRHRDVVKHIVEKIDQTGADGVYSDMIYVDRTDLSKIKRYWRAGNYGHGDFLWGWMPGHLSFFARREVYQKYGTFRLDLRSAADYELLLRFIHKHRIKLAYLNETTIVMREGGVSNANLSNRMRANGEDRKAWELNGLKPHFFTLTLKPLRKLVQLIRREPS
ncbi:MAG: glycosyltransferase [Cytophagales bacterium]|nr:MAG: glycosyltransferase [Cytophagales bacterium]